MTARRDFLTLAAGLVTAGAMVPVSASATQPHADAELIRVGTLLDQAVACETAAWEASEGENDDDAPETVRAVSACEATGKIARQINALTARTIDGLFVKMSAFAWCKGWRPITVDEILPHGNWTTPATSELLMVSVLADLDAMRRAGA